MTNENRELTLLPLGKALSARATHGDEWGKITLEKTYDKFVVTPEPCKGRG